MNIKDLVNKADASVKEKMSANESEQPVQEVVQENIEPEQSGGSSLKEENQTQPTEQQSVSNTSESVEQPVQEESSNVVNLDGSPTQSTVQNDGVREDEILKYLSEKLGREVSSIDEITAGQATQKKIPAFAEGYAKWVEETGYDDPSLYMKTQATDYGQMSDKDLIVEDYMLSKGLTKEEAEFRYKRNFGEKDFDPDLLDESEANEIKESNKAKEIERTIAAREARSKFEKLKEQFAQPKEGYTKQSETQAVDVAAEAQKFWNENANNALEDLKEIVIPITKDKGYKMSFNDYLGKNQNDFQDVNKFFSTFMNEETNTWDVNKLAKAKAYLENMPNIASSIYRQGLSDGSKSVVSTGKNLNFDSTERQQPESKQLSDKQEKVGRDLAALQEKLTGRRMRF